MNADGGIQHRIPWQLVETIPFAKPTRQPAARCSERVTFASATARVTYQVTVNSYRVCALGNAPGATQCTYLVMVLAARVPYFSAGE
jgi:hypothetical protein